MKVSIVGTGYVGLVTGACLAEKGHSVTCVDVDSVRVGHINRGEVPFHEPGLSALVQRHVGRRLKATTDLSAAVKESALTLISVGTPFDGKEIDLRFVRTAAAQIGRALRGKSSFHAVVVKSTVVPGTTDDVVTPAVEQESGKKVGTGFGVGMNPEFLSEGEAVHDFMNPDRIVLGGSDARTIRSLAKLYQPFAGVPVIRTTNRIAEMIKYASNSLLATLISFSNEMGNLCSDLGGLDCATVMEGVHLSQYLSPALPNGERVKAPITAFLRAGCGFGGSCLPKDVRALIACAGQAGAEVPLLKSVVRINDRQSGRMLSLVRKHFPDLRGLPVTVLGLSFKPGTDDVRESPAFPVIRGLLSGGAVVTAYDPVAMPAARRAFRLSGLKYAGSLSEAVHSARAVFLITAWDEFRRLPALVRRLRPAPVVVDGRRLLHSSDVSVYEGIGLGTRRASCNQ